jgi:ketosteroid isomerase-like protein
VSERADVALRIIEAVMRQEDAIALGLIAADIEYVNPPGAMEPGTRRGHDGWRTAIRALYDSWDAVDYDLVSVEETDDRVLILTRMRMRGRASGIDTGFDMGLLLSISDGKVVRAEWFFDHESARAAAGLEQSP